MISREAYKILHDIDSSSSHWLDVKMDDPRLVRVRKILKATERPGKDTIKYDDAGILKMIKKRYTNVQIAEIYGLNVNTMYAHIKKTPVLKENYEKNLHEFRTIIAIKNGKKCAAGSPTSISKKLGLKRRSVSYALLANKKLFGYTFVRLQDWRKTK